MSDPILLDAFRKQCRHVKQLGLSPYAALLLWKDQPGVEWDDLMDITKEVAEE